MCNGVWVSDDDEDDDTFDLFSEGLCTEEDDED
jgi:hypothetical protein